MKRLLLFVMLFALTFVNSTNCQSKETVDLSAYFSKSDGSFVLYDYENDKYTHYNPEMCAERFTPASTFKILNSMIGLETKAVKDENEIIKWDGKTRSVESWNRDHNLKSGIKYSVVWMYRELARRIGEERMQEYINKVGYGNNDISGGIDRFWLGSSLKISADEQIEFLKRLHENKLPFSQHSIDILKSILTGEDGEGYKIRAKTGLSDIDEDKIFGWYVGFVFTEDNTYLFALNMMSNDFENVMNSRVKKTKQILRHLGVVK